MVKKKKKVTTETNQFWAESAQIMMQLGLTMVGCITFCFFVGKYLDDLFKTKGIFLIIFILFGVFGGANVSYRQIMKITSPPEKETTEKTEKHGDN